MTHSCCCLFPLSASSNTHEIWALLHFLLPKVFASSEPFDSCFDLATNSIDQDRLFKIHTLLKPLMLRRIKSEIQQKLPKKTEVKIFVGLTSLQQEWYKKLVSRDMQLLLKRNDDKPQSSSSAGNEWRRSVHGMQEVQRASKEFVMQHWLTLRWFISLCSCAV